MKKEKNVRAYQRRTKSGKMITVKAHKASYDAAEEMRKAIAKKEGAGSELSKRKAVVDESPLGFSADEFKAWYHWDTENDPKNKEALKVEKALKKSMGAKAYKKFYDEMTDSYSARGHNKAFKGLGERMGSKEASPERPKVKEHTTSVGKDPNALDPSDKGSTRRNVAAALKRGEITPERARSLLGSGLKPGTDKVLQKIDKTQWYAGTSGGETLTLGTMGGKKLGNAQYVREYVGETGIKGADKNGYAYRISVSVGNESLTDSSTIKKGTRVNDEGGIYYSSPEKARAAAVEMLKKYHSIKNKQPKAKGTSAEIKRGKTWEARVKDAEAIIAEHKRRQDAEKAAKEKARKVKEGEARKRQQDKLDAKVAERKGKYETTSSGRPKRSSVNMQIAKQKLEAFVSKSPYAKVLKGARGGDALITRLQRNGASFKEAVSISGKLQKLHDEVSSVSVIKPKKNRFTK